MKGVNAQVCQQGHAHAFVLKSSVPMGEKVAHWMIWESLDTVFVKNIHFLLIAKDCSHGG